MKIHEYNEMMAYLTRPAMAQGGVIGKGGMFQGQDMGYRTGFSNYKNTLLTPAVAKNANIDIFSLSPEYQKLFNEGNLFYTRIKGGPKKGDATRHKIKSVYGSKEKIDTILGNIIPDDISKLPDEVSNAGKLGNKLRNRFIQEYLENLPKGDTINLDATTRILDEKIRAATNGKITMKDKRPLMQFLESDLNTNKIKKPKSVEEAKAVQFKDYNIDRIAVNNIAEELNKKYNLEDKGIKFLPRVSKGGSISMRLSFTGGPFVKTGDKTKWVRSMDRVATTEGIAELEKELQKIMKTKVFKDYSVAKAISEKSGKKPKYNQPEVFEYLLKGDGNIDLKQAAKDLKITPDTLDNAIKNLHQNVYFSASPKVKKGRFLDGYSYDELMKVKDRIQTLDDKYYRRTLEFLLQDAYGKVPEKLKPLLNKLEKFRELQKKLPKEYKEYFTAQLDHVIPYSFLKQIDEGADPENLIKVKAYPGYLNQMAFKGNIDTALNNAVTAGDKELVKTITELRDFLPEDFGSIDSKGKKIINYGAEPFNLKTLYSEQQKKFGKAYERAFKFLDDPKVSNLLKKSGIGFEAIRNLRRLNAPGFLESFNKILKQNPDLRVQYEDQFKDDSRLLASEGGRIKLAEGSEGLPAETLPAIAAAAYKPVKGLAKGAFRGIVSPLAGAGFAASELMSDDPNVSIAGLEMLYPDIMRRLGSKVTTLENFYDKALRMGVPVKYVPQLIKGMTGAGLIMIAGDVGYKTKKWAEENLDFDRPLTEEQRTDIQERKTAVPRMFDTYEQASKIAKEQGISYEDALKQLDTPNVPGINFNQGGRVGFDEGSKPKNPNRRAFLKGVTALAALPLVGRFFKLTDVAKQASTYMGPTIEKVKGMPEWFPQLVKKLFNEGEDVTKQAAFKDRQVVKRGTLEGGDDVDMIYDLDTGNVSIEVTPHSESRFKNWETKSGAYNKEYSLDYTKGQADEMTKGKKPPDEFGVSEVEGSADPDAMDVNWDINETTVNDAMSDLTELEAFAKNKTTTQIHRKKGTKPKDVFPDYDYDPLDDY